MNLHEWLNKRGYQGPVNDPYKDYSVYFYRRIRNTNHQWIVREHTIPMKGNTYHGFEVEMCYETEDGTWVDSKFYALDEKELRKKLPSLEKRLYAAVEAMGGNPKNYRKDSRDA